MAERLDVRLVRDGLARSRAHAKELVAAGAVCVDGAVASKVSLTVTGDAQVSCSATDDWVGRGAHKLLGALAAFGPDGLAVAGRRCVDVGACTGGFTQVLLRAGAAHVVALDVGHDQLHPSLRADPRVTDLPGCNVRDATASSIGGAADLLVADLSFISLRLVLPVLCDLVHDGGDLVLLVKPQFEVGRERLGRNGIVRDPAAHRDALRSVLTTATEHGLCVLGLARSPVRGTEGNTEYLAWLRRSAQPGVAWESLETSITDLTRPTEEDAS